MYDALYAWRERQEHNLTKRLSALILFHADSEPSNLQMLEFYSQDNHSQAMKEWFDPEVRKDWDVQRLNYWGGGGVGCFLGAVDLLGSESKALSKLADGILNTVLTGNRPLARWRTSLMQPLMFEMPSHKKEILTALHKELSNGQGGFGQVKVRDDEQRYFLKHLQESLGVAGSKLGMDLDKAILGKSIKSYERLFEDLYFGQ